MSQPVYRAESTQKGGILADLVPGGQKPKEYPSGATVFALNGNSKKTCLDRDRGLKMDERWQILVSRSR